MRLQFFLGAALFGLVVPQQTNVTGHLILLTEHVGINWTTFGWITQDSEQIIRQISAYVHAVDSLLN